MDGTLTASDWVGWNCEESGGTLPANDAIDVIDAVDAMDAADAADAIDAIDAIVCNVE